MDKLLRRLTKDTHYIFTHDFTLFSKVSFRTLFDDISGMIVDGVRQNKCKLSDGRAC